MVMFTYLTCQFTISARRLVGVFPYLADWTIAVCLTVLQRKQETRGLRCVPYRSAGLPLAL